MISSFPCRRQTSPSSPGFGFVGALCAFRTTLNPPRLDLRRSSSVWSSSDNARSLARKGSIFGRENANFPLFPSRCCVARFRVRTSVVFVYPASGLLTCSTLAILCGHSKVNHRLFGAQDCRGALGEWGDSNHLHCKFTFEFYLVAAVGETQRLRRRTTRILSFIPILGEDYYYFCYYNTGRGVLMAFPVSALQRASTPSSPTQRLKSVFPTRTRLR